MFSFYYFVSQISKVMHLIETTILKTCPCSLQQIILHILVTKCAEKHDLGKAGLQAGWVELY